MDNKIDSKLDVFRLGGVVAELSDDLLIVSVGEGSLQNLVDVWLAVVLVESHLGVQALLNDVGGELELRKSDEVLGDLSEDLFILLPVLELEYILN